MSENTTAVTAAEKADTAAAEVKGTKQEEKSFSQDEVNAIVQKRLAEEKAKTAELTKSQAENEERERVLSEREKAIELSERKFRAREELSNKGFPTELVDFLNCESEESVTAGIEKLAGILKKYAESSETLRPTGMTAKLGTVHSTPIGGGGDDGDFMKGFNNYKV